MSLHLVPVSSEVAKDAVTRWHRHNAAPWGELFRVGAATEDGVLWEATP